MKKKSNGGIVLLTRSQGIVRLKKAKYVDAKNGLPVKLSLW
jgi:hypothetical protein